MLNTSDSTPPMANKQAYQEVFNPDLLSGVDF